MEHGNLHRKGECNSDPAGVVPDDNGIRHEPAPNVHVSLSLDGTPGIFRENRAGQTVSKIGLLTGLWNRDIFPPSVSAAAGRFSLAT
jgi:hypothetical protein